MVLENFIRRLEVQDAGGCANHGECGRAHDLLVHSACGITHARRMFG